jgi:hypothetical protein
MATFQMKRGSALNREDSYFRKEKMARRKSSIDELNVVNQASEVLNGEISYQ